MRAQHWKLVFHHFDQNHNGAIDGDELKTALEQFDYKLSEPLQDLLQRKYGTGLPYPMSFAHYSRLFNLS